jgi:septal ring factor EnvC (AmiA/AmiB activator)
MATLVAVGLLLAPLAARAQTAQTLEKDKAAQTLEEANQTLEATKARRQALEAARKALGKEIAQLNRQIIETASLVQNSEGRLSELERNLRERETLRKVLEADFGREARKLSAILVSLQRMGANPPPAIITRRRDALSMVRSALMLSKVFPEYRDQALLLRRKLEKLDGAILAERSERDKVKLERDRMAADQARLENLMDEKRIAMTDADKEIDGLGEVAKVQAKQVADSRELVRKLDKEIAEKTTLGAYEAELAQSASKATLGAATAALAPDTAAPQATASLAEPSAEAAPGDTGLDKPLSADVAFLDPGRIKPAMPFEEAKGRLPHPVSGDRVLAFGQQTRSGSKSKGVAFATREAAQITSPCDGWVVYAGEFRSYDQVLIINAGGGYHLLLAGMAQINVQVGQFVLSGEPVGKMGQVRAAASGGNPTRPILYLELRSKERPINPDPWWGPSGQKVANG